MTEHDVRPCLIEAPHPPHCWTPLVVDPGDPHVLHVFRDVPLRCPGQSAGDAPYIEESR